MNVKIPAVPECYGAVPKTRSMKNSGLIKIQFDCDSLFTHFVLLLNTDVNPVSSGPSRHVTYSRPANSGCSSSHMSKL